MILVIDNYEKSYMGQLRSLLKKNGVRYKIKDFRKVSMRDTKDVDAIILSGGAGISNNPYFPEFSKEADLIKKFRKPILGICLGFEIICHAYESESTETKIFSHLERGIFRIKIRKKDDIFKGCPKIMKVFDCHRWSFIRASKKLEVLATSRDGIEAVKHRTKPIYGVQFHPEVTWNNQGYMAFENFLKMVS